MKISDLGEFGLIERIAPLFNNLMTLDIKGIGDDCAVLPMDDKYNLVVTTDMLIEGVHFLKDKITPNELGHKVLAVNLSDIAAMGATPIASFLSFALPDNTDVQYIDDFMSGYHSLSQKYNTPLLGGDTVKSDKNLVFNVTLIGKVEKEKVRLRNMAQNGDIIAVTDYLGDSAAGLNAILNDINTPTAENLKKKHTMPHPHINEGLWLSNQLGVNAMMDVSDGLASDIKHILRASKKNASIELTQIPLSNDYLKYIEENNLNKYEFSTSGGEDYCLLLTISKDRFEEISKRYHNKFNKELFNIGEVCDGKGEISFFNNGQKVEKSKDGFTHF